MNVVGVDDHDDAHATRKVRGKTIGMLSATWHQQLLRKRPLHRSPYVRITTSVAVAGDDA